MDDLPKDVLGEIRKHVVAGQLEWELWRREQEDQRLMNALHDDAARGDTREE